MDNFMVPMLDAKYLMSESIFVSMKVSLSLIEMDYLVFSFRELTLHCLRAFLLFKISYSA
jgi:hypothetical protein